MPSAERSIAELEARVGERVAFRDEDLANTEGTRDNFRQFASGSLDGNPLWHDEDYAKATKWGGLVAKPTWLASVLRPPMCRTCFVPEGFAAVDGEVHWEFINPVKVGDRFRVFGELAKVQPKEMRAFGASAVTSGVTLYETAEGTPLARVTSVVIQYLRAGVSAKRTADSQPISPATGPDLLAPYVALARVKRRGPEPRYWDDVVPGQQLEPVRRGTVTQGEILQWYMGYHPMNWWRDVRDLAARVADGETVDLPERALDFYVRHLDPAVAQRDGIPTGFDVGVQRTAWLSEYIHNWIGDAGTLIKLSCRFRGLLYHGDTPEFSGIVVSKLRDGDLRLVNLEVSIKNHRGELVSPCSAVVALPSRGGPE